MDDLSNNECNKNRQNPQKINDISVHLIVLGARGSEVVKALCKKQEGRRFEPRRSPRLSSLYLILPAALDSDVYSASNRNEYQTQK
jgi:hypothetical protein